MILRVGCVSILFAAYLVGCSSESREGETPALLKHSVNYSLELVSTNGDAVPVKAGERYNAKDYVKIRGSWKANDADERFFCALILNTEEKNVAGDYSQYFPWPLGAKKGDSGFYLKSGKVEMPVACLQNNFDLTCPNLGKSKDIKVIPAIACLEPGENDGSVKYKGKEFALASFKGEEGNYFTLDGYILSRPHDELKKDAFVLSF